MDIMYCCFYDNVALIHYCQVIIKILLKQHWEPFLSLLGAIF